MAVLSYTKMKYYTEVFLFLFVTKTKRESDAGMDFTAGPLILTGEFPGGPARFVMRRSGGPFNFWDIQKV